MIQAPALRGGTVTGTTIPLDPATLQTIVAAVAAQLRGEPMTNAGGEAVEERPTEGGEGKG